MLQSSLRRSDSKSFKKSTVSLSFKNPTTQSTTSVTSLTESSTSNEPPPAEDLTYKNVSLITYEDLEDVRRLLNEDSKEIYNVDDPFPVIHRCYLSFKLVDSKGKIVAVLCSDEFPNVPSLSPVAWTHWASKLYNIKDLNSYNSMWVHLAACDESYRHTFLHPILNNLFHKQIKKQYILFVIPGKCHDKVSYLDGCSSVILPQDFTDSTLVQTLRLCVRQDFITQYKVRRAVEEDNDDLVPLIHQFSPRFVELYGEYYIAEIITRRPEAGRQIIVAEHQGEAVAVLCLNPNVNHLQINECFDLHVFTNFYKMETAVQSPRSKNKQALITSPIPQAPKVIAIKSSIIQADTVIMISPDWGSFDSSIDSPEITSSATLVKMQTFSVLNKIDQFTRDNSSTSAYDSITQSQMTSAMSSEQVSVVETPSVSIEDIDTPSCDWPYFGVENAFAVEILASQEKHIPSLDLLIISCFESYPNRDYCLLTIPHDADYSPILKYFVKVQPRVGTTHPHVLYVCHRGQLSPIKVELADENDLGKVNHFVSLLKHPGEIKANFEKGISGEEPIQTLLAMSGRDFKSIVGLAQVSSVPDLASIKGKYVVNAISETRHDNNFSFGYFLAFSMSPLFNRHVKYFLREIHCMTAYQNLFYALNTHDGQEYRIRPLSFLMQEMWLVPPRKLQVTVKKVCTEYPEEPYALFMCTPKLLSNTVIHVNQRIVVIGASSTALAFLEQLTRTPTTKNIVTFNNVVLVSTEGLPFDGTHNYTRDMLLASHTFVDMTYLEMIALRSAINVVSGSLTGINRKEKCVKIDKKVIIPYEYLFLMTGLQYGVPLKKGSKELRKIKLPSNCFTINNSRDGDKALETLGELIAEQGTKDYQIVIYGHSIDCYCCIAALHEFGVPGHNILLIEPWPKDQETNNDFVFQDGEVYETVVNNVRKKGTEILTGYKLIDWCSQPLSLKFESRTRYLILSPMCAFLFNDKAVDMKLFQAVHEAGLVFDGRLVINTDCQTNDPFIFAAGPMTKYSRKLWSDHLTHAHFNSEEIGGTLGRKVRAMLLPFKEALTPNYNLSRSYAQESKYLVPVYFEPLKTYCQLPGGLHYLNVCKPGAQVPLETAMCDTDYGSVLSTGNCKNLKDQGYFRVHLNTYRTIETITCLSLQKFDHKKFVLLWGKHEALLNNLVRRFESIYITDLFTYFQKPWCSAIFIEDFAVLESAVMKIMTSLSEIPGESPIEDLYKIYTENGFKPLSHADRDRINEKFADSGYAKTIHQLIMDFIRDNLGVLDMYAHPIIVNYILSGYEESPMFKNI